MSLWPRGLKTADKSTARLVLWTLAGSRRAMSLQEIDENVIVAEPHDVLDALNELRDAGVLVQERDQWAISAELPGVALWAESFGRDALDDTAGAAGEDDRLLLVVDALNLAIEAMPGPAADVRIQLRDELFRMAFHKYLQQGTVNRGRRSLGGLSGSYVQATHVSMASQHAEPDAWPRTTGRVSTLRGRLLAFLRWLLPRRPSPDAMCHITVQMKGFFDTIGPPPGWRPPTKAAGGVGGQ